MKGIYCSNGTKYMTEVKNNSSYFINTENDWYMYVRFINPTTQQEELEDLPLKERERMFEPLFQATEEISDNAKGKSCQKLSGYIQQFITGFLMDLVDYRYQPV